MICWLFGLGVFGDFLFSWFWGLCDIHSWAGFGFSIWVLCLGCVAWFASILTWIGVYGFR